MEKNVFQLPESFKGVRSFTVQVKGAGEVRVDYSDTFKVAFHFGLHGSVSETGYRSNFLYKEQLRDYPTPEAAAEALALHLYEHEGGKEYAKERRAKADKERQLSLFN